MNWLAHLLLSEPSSAFRIGGLLPDLVSAPVLAHMSLEFQRGIQRHQEIDIFTDAHPVFRRSVRRIDPPHRRFGGILVDLFYDHFLSCDWAAYSDTALPVLVAQVYDSFEVHRSEIPAEAYIRLKQMQAGNWLNSYGQIDGMHEVVRRLGMRFRRPVDLTPCIGILERDYDALRVDFAEFFPEVLAFAKRK